MKQPPTKHGSKKLSEVAKHLVLPSGIASTGWPAVRDKAKEFGVLFDRWQDGLGRGILAKRSNGLYAAGIGGIIISICRQVGKTFSIGTIIFALCILFPRLKVLWTAHLSRTSDETFKWMQGFARRRKIAPHIEQVRQANGQQEIHFKNGSRIMFGARERGFGRGFDSVDIEVFDEAQILTQKALDDMVPATNASKNPLIIFMGTPPKPTDPGEVFRTRRNEALAIKKRRADGEVVECDMFYTELGADPKADLEDKMQVEKANPSFPHRVPWESILRMRKILADDESYRREGLGIWDDDRESSGAITETRWAELAVNVAPETDPVYSISFSIDGMRMALAAAKLNGENVFVEQLHDDAGALEDGMKRLAAWFAEKDENGITRWRRSRGIFISGSSHAPTLAQMLRRAGVASKWVTVLNTPQVFAACQMLDNELKAGTVEHPSEGQERLDASVSTVMKEPRGKQGAWAWASVTPDGDETPTEAISFALWGARTTKLSAKKHAEGEGGAIL
ncbi:terminase [Leucobacter viscericola]|uniref:Terminase n=1 Tax=Leucobacter viscericola TaxID=2714935 RepID=A0A6G7XCX2_9MICO|nr:terminase [Leucobacter viscericola]QIK62352.1 terminase [Leucobacter viscericola]